MLSLFTRFAVLCLIGIAPARAVVFEAMDFNRLAVESEQVFIGTVDSYFSVKTSPRDIFTDFRFVDIEVVKGPAPGFAATVRMLGGTVGDMTITIPGAPTFQVGRRYLVFVAGNQRVIFPTLGGSQGIFQIRENEATGRSEVYDYGGRPLNELPGLGLRGSREKSVVLAPAMSTEIFVGEIVKRMGRQP